MKKKLIKNRKIRITIDLLACTLIVAFLLFFPYLIVEKQSENGYAVIYSDDDVKNNIDMQEVTSQLQKYDINLAKKCNVFESSSRKQYRLLNCFLDNGKNTLGRNYLLLNRIVLNSDMPSTRSAEKILIHEIGHSYLKQKFGYLESKQMPRWKKEGFCDYISESSTLSDEEGFKMLIDTKAQNDEQKMQFLYFKYRLFYRFLIEEKQMTIPEILEAEIDTKSLEKEIISNYLETNE